MNNKIKKLLKTRLQKIRFELDSIDYIFTMDKSRYIKECITKQAILKRQMQKIYSLLGAYMNNKEKNRGL